MKTIIKKEIISFDSGNITGEVSYDYKNKI